MPEHDDNEYTPPMWHQRLSAFRPYLLGIMVVCLCYAGWMKFTDPNFMPFKTVKIITTSNYINSKQLQNTIAQNIQGGFFSLKTNALKQSILQLPWANSVAIRRIWPSTLAVTVYEQEPVARWNQNQLINAQSQVFTPPMNTMPKGMPQLFGPPDMQAQVLTFYLQTSAQIEPLHTMIKRLTLTPRLAWEMTLGNGMRVMLGRTNVEQRLARFIEAYPKIIGKKTNAAATVDLRYPNGIAVQWKKEV